MSAVNPSIKDLYVKEFVGAMQGICEENFHNMQNYQKPNQLAKGIYYGNQYFHALKDTGQMPRLNFFLERNAFYHGWASPKMFDQLGNPKSPTGKAVNSWIIKAGISASVALKVLREGPTMLSCGEVLGIADYMALQKVLGDKKFDILFSSPSPMALTIMNSLPTKQSLRTLRPINKLEEIDIGESGYIMGVPQLYQAKHINGEAQAFNILCSGNQEKQRVLAFGVDPKQGRGVTVKRMVKVLLEEQNKTPETMELYTNELSQKILATYQPQALLQCEKLKNMTLTMDQFKAHGGGKFLAKRVTMDYSKLSLLFEKAPEEGLKYMKIWTSGK